MSIYATAHQFKMLYPDRWGDNESDWIEVTAQCVPGHIGHPSYTDGKPDAYADFLPPPSEDEELDRAVVFITNDTVKVGQQYIDPLLVLSGDEWRSISFLDLWERLEDALAAQEQRETQEY